MFHRFADLVPHKTTHTHTHVSEPVAACGAASGDLRLSNEQLSRRANPPYPPAL